MPPRSNNQSAVSAPGPHDDDHAGLRLELARLEARLAADANWRALCQLREREDNGELLEPALAATLRRSIMAKLRTNNLFLAHEKIGDTLALLSNIKVQDEQEPAVLPEEEDLHDAQELKACAPGTMPSTCNAAFSPRAPGAVASPIATKSDLSSSSSQPPFRTNVRIKQKTVAASTQQVAFVNHEPATGSPAPDMDVTEVADQPAPATGTDGTAQGVEQPIRYAKLRRKRALAIAGSPRISKTAASDRSVSSTASDSPVTSSKSTPAGPLVGKDRHLASSAQLEPADMGPADIEPPSASELAPGDDTMPAQAVPEPAAPGSTAPTPITPEEKATQAARKLASIAAISQIVVSPGNRSLVPSLEPSMVARPAAQPSAFLPVARSSPDNSAAQKSSTMARATKKAAEPKPAIDPPAPAKDALAPGKPAPKHRSEPGPPGIMPKGHDYTGDFLSQPFVADPGVSGTTSLVQALKSASGGPRHNHKAPVLAGTNQVEAAASCQHIERTPAPPATNTIPSTTEFLDQAGHGRRSPRKDPLRERPADDELQIDQLETPCCSETTRTQMPLADEALRATDEPPVFVHEIDRRGKIKRASVPSRPADTDFGVHGDHGQSHEDQVEIKQKPVASAASGQSAFSMQRTDRGERHPGFANSNGHKPEAEVVIKVPGDFDVTTPSRLPDQLHLGSKVASYKTRRENQIESHAAYHMAMDEASVVIIHRGEDEETPDLPFFKQNAHWEREGTIRKFLKALTGD